MSRASAVSDTMGPFGKKILILPNGPVVPADAPLPRSARNAAPPGSIRQLDRRRRAAARGPGQRASDDGEGELDGLVQPLGRVPQPVTTMITGRMNCCLTGPDGAADHAPDDDEDDQGDVDGDVGDSHGSSLICGQHRGGAGEPASHNRCEPGPADWLARFL